MMRWRTLGLLLLIPALLAAKPERRRRPHPGRPAEAERTAQPGPAPGSGKRPASSGDRLLAAGRYQEAAVAYSVEVQKNPEATAPWVGWGTALSRLGKCSEALEKLSPYAYTRPFKAETALLAARCSSRLGYADDAVYFDTLALERTPGSISARTALAVDLDRAGDYLGRDIVLEQLALVDPDRDASLFAEAAVALRHGDIDTFDMIDLLWRREGRADDELVLLRAISWLDVGDPYRAFTELHKERKVRRSNGERLAIAEALRRMSRPEDALAELDRKLFGRLRGADTDAMRARVLVDLGRDAEANAVLLPWLHTVDEELIASRWYLGRAQGDADAMADAKTRWELARSSPLRVLEQLIP